MLTLGKKISRWYRTQTRVRKTVRELSALSNRDLSDIGISRCDIHRVAKENMRSWSAL